MQTSTRIVLSFSYDRVFTYGAMRNGICLDRERREFIRELVADRFPLLDKATAQSWEVNIHVRRMQPLDLDNVLKIIIDAFSKRQIRRDGSKWDKVGIWPDDSLPYIKAITITGELGVADATSVEILGCYET